MRSTPRWPSQRVLASRQWSAYLRLEPWLSAGATSLLMVSVVNDDDDLKWSAISLGCVLVMYLSTLPALGHAMVDDIHSRKPRRRPRGRRRWLGYGFMGVALVPMAYFLYAGWHGPVAGVPH